MKRDLTSNEIDIVSGGLTQGDDYASDTSDDGGFDDGDDGGYGGVDDNGADDGDTGQQQPTNQDSQTPNSNVPDPDTQTVPGTTDNLNQSSSFGTPPQLAPTNNVPNLTGPNIPVGGGYSVQPGIYGSPTNPSGGGIGIKKTF